MKTVFFDLHSGASGDMILAALCDCGAPAEWLAEQFGRLHLHGLTFSVEKVKRSGIVCAHLVINAEHAHEHRRLPDLLAIIRSGGFSAAVNDRCARVLTRLGQAEAKVHGVALDQVHFHEIGAVDTIVDVLGAALCLEHLGIDEVWFSDLTVGHGVITTAHGVMPSPAPATLEMMAGFRVKHLDVEAEILTPTGCAILTALGTQTAGVPSGNVLAVGYGCGDKTFETLPNLLRAVIVDTGVEAEAPMDVAVIESEMDHICGEVMAYAAQRLMDCGALDVSWTPVFMKKGRPGYRLTVVAEPAKIREMAAIAMAETRTLGVRISRPQRICAERTVHEVEFMGALAREKRCSIGGKTFTKLEFESLASIARTTGRPLMEVMEEYERGRHRHN